MPKTDFFLILKFYISELTNTESRLYLKSILKY